MARTKSLSYSNIIRPLCGLIYGEYLTLVLDVTRHYQTLLKIEPTEPFQFV
jgi:hypothetical protein